MQFHFDHETLEVYQVALGVTRWMTTVEFPRGWAWLKDQATRAAGSVVLNIAEGRARTGAARRQHYLIALGSAAEACAALDVLPLPEGQARQDELRRVGAMLARLAR